MSYDENIGRTLDRLTFARIFSNFNFWSLHNTCFEKPNRIRVQLFV